jgi:hypothetical protein
LSFSRTMPEIVKYAVIGLPAESSPITANH